MEIGMTADFIKKIRNYMQSNSEENKLYICVEEKECEYDCFSGELYENSDIYTLTISEKGGIYFSKNAFNGMQENILQGKQEKYAGAKGADLEDEELDLTEFIPDTECEEMSLQAEYEAYKSVAMAVLKNIIEKYGQEREKITVFTKEGDVLLKCPIKEDNADAWKNELKNIKRIVILLESRFNIPKWDAVDTYQYIEPDQIKRNYLLKTMYQLGKMHILLDLIEGRKIDSFSKKDGTRYLTFNNSLLAGISWDYGASKIVEFQTPEDIPEL